MDIIGVIPARYSSSRFPGKPLAYIKNKTMIQHVYENVSKVKHFNRVVVATDDQRIVEHVEGFGGDVISTSNAHKSGTERMGEVAQKVKGDFFVNIQGDEPLIQTELLANICEEAKMTPSKIISAMTDIESINEYESPNVVKVVATNKSEALYFSRSPIPYFREVEAIMTNVKKHIGIYGFSNENLALFGNLPESKLEEAEKLEQLRLLENGFNIKLVKSEFSSFGVDIPEDIEKIIENMEEYKHD